MSRVMIVGPDDLVHAGARQTDSDVLQDCCAAYPDAPRCPCWQHALASHVELKISEVAGRPVSCLWCLVARLAPDDADDEEEP